MNINYMDLLWLQDAAVEKEYRINTLAQTHGHEVLRLPPYFCIFNPIEMVWAQLKTNVRKNNTISVRSIGRRWTKLEKSCGLAAVAC